VLAVLLGVSCRRGYSVARTVEDLLGNKLLSDLVEVLSGHHSVLELLMCGGLGSLDSHRLALGTDDVLAVLAAGLGLALISAHDLREEAVVC